MKGPQKQNTALFVVKSQRWTQTAKNDLCKILNKLSPQSVPSAVDGQAKIKATFFLK